MKESGVYFILVIVLAGVYGCGHIKVSGTRDQIMKVMTHERVSGSTVSFFNATYDPLDSSFMSHYEIEWFLKKAKITTDTLPASLQTALKERRVVGLLVSRFVPIKQKSTQGVLKKLDKTSRMLLQWEKSLDFKYGLGSLWFNENTECKGGKSKCTDWEGCSKPDWTSLCTGYQSCPPCRKCPPCGVGGGVRDAQ